MTKEPNREERIVPFIGEGHPDGECANDWFVTCDEFARNAAAAVVNAQNSNRSAPSAGQDQTAKAVEPGTAMESPWMPDYTAIPTGKVHFLMDCSNLAESTWLRGRTILSDHGVRKFFTEMCVLST
jgi:hypothetical protein